VGKSKQMQLAPLHEERKGRRKKTVGRQSPKFSVINPTYSKRRKRNSEGITMARHLPNKFGLAQGRGEKKEKEGGGG